MPEQMELGAGAQDSLFQAPGGVRDDQGLHLSSDLLGQMESSSPDIHWVAYPICHTTLTSDKALSLLSLRHSEIKCHLKYLVSSGGS